MNLELLLFLVSFLTVCLAVALFSVINHYKRKLEKLDEDYYKDINIASEANIKLRKELNECKSSKVSSKK